MKQATLICVVTLVCVLSSVDSACAVYTGLQVVGTPVIAGGAPRTMYRVYAVFTDANDYLCVVNGSPTASTMVIESRNFEGTAIGGAFFNPVMTHATRPTVTEVFGGIDGNSNPVPPIADAQFDTFVTIGLPAGVNGPPNNPEDDQTRTSPGFPSNFITGNSFVASNQGWYVPGPIEQGRAGWLGDGDPVLRVLMMQLTVNAGDNVRGTVNISGVNNTDLAGAFAFTVSGQTFNSVPAPGGLIVPAAFALLCRSRQRRHESIHTISK